MEVLATKIAELLDVTIEQAILLYPILRTQFIINRMLVSLQCILVIPLMMVLIFIFNKSYDYFELKTKLNNRMYNDESDVKRLHDSKLLAQKFVKIGVGILSVLFISNLLIYALSPDLMIIMKFLR